MLKEVPRDHLTFHLPEGYRLLESEHVVALVDPNGRTVFLGPATRTTPEVLLAAIARSGDDPGGRRAP
ncbi:MAG: hypothetical protein QN142_01090 [Armatimonadota bacterium]|nr:hypothetical protein [Armatimonadota bacterium]MDR5676300.1 hypothetical protein [Armatimonadota bacterium]MDR7387000.1 hypothetical protein [Armatimonadota bacterium]MDR7388314.1 hypothetical protein [Armatimonadota bacterium]MDR7392330.1 hypothetical protein [Armatimonadota bacterium]